LQRSRKRGSRTPAGAIYAGRPSLLGNPFSARLFGHARSVKLHAGWLSGSLAALGLERLGFGPAEVDALARLRTRVLDALPGLAGRDLQCWCPLSSRWCHVDTLLHLASRTVDPDSAPA
jgi:hypothetical protein